MSVEEEYRMTIQLQRNELQVLQRRCNELLHERGMMKAATAEDMRNFCLNYQREQLQRQQQQQQQQTGTTTVTPPDPAVGRSTSLSSTDVIPIAAIMGFLHQYSAGMVPRSLCSRRKRLRESMEAGTLTRALSQQRLVKRVVARQRLRLREDDLEDVQQQVREPELLQHEQPY